MAPVGCVVERPLESLVRARTRQRCGQGWRGARARRCLVEACLFSVGADPLPGLIRTPPQEWDMCDDLAAHGALCPLRGGRCGAVELERHTFLLSGLGLQTACTTSMFNFKTACGTGRADTRHHPSCGVSPSLHCTRTS